LNPNVLYLQSTPMTEPLLLATTTVAVAMMIRWCDSESRYTNGETAGLKACTTRGAIDSSAGLQACHDRRGGVQSSTVGWAFALACLTRYEAWPVTVIALVAAVWTRWRRKQPLTSALRDVGAIAAYPALAIISFALFSRVVIGEWFVGNDFFVPENKA